MPVSWVDERASVLGEGKTQYIGWRRESVLWGKANGLVEKEQMVKSHTYSSVYRRQDKNLVIEPWGTINRLAETTKTHLEPTGGRN